MIDPSLNFNKKKDKMHEVTSFREPETSKLDLFIILLPRHNLLFFLHIRAVFFKNRI